MSEMWKHEGGQDYFRIQFQNGRGQVIHSQRRPVRMFFKIRIFVSITKYRPGWPVIANSSFIRCLFAFFCPTALKLIDSFIVLEKAVLFSSQFFKIGVIGL